MWDAKYKHVLLITCRNNIVSLKISISFSCIFSFMLYALTFLFVLFVNLQYWRKWLTRDSSLQLVMKWFHLKSLLKHLSTVQCCSQVLSVVWFPRGLYEWWWTLHATMQIYTVLVIVTKMLQTKLSHEIKSNALRSISVN